MPGKGAPQRPPPPGPAAGRMRVPGEGSGRAAAARGGAGAGEGCMHAGLKLRLPLTVRGGGRHRSCVRRGALGGAGELPCPGAVGCGIRAPRAPPRSPHPHPSPHAHRLRPAGGVARSRWTWGKAFRACKTLGRAHARLHAAWSLHARGVWERVGPAQGGGERGRGRGVLFACAQPHSTARGEAARCRWPCPLPLRASRPAHSAATPTTTATAATAGGARHRRPPPPPCR